MLEKNILGEGLANLGIFAWNNANIYYSLGYLFQIYMCIMHKGRGGTEPISGKILKPYLSPNISNLFQNQTDLLDMWNNAKE